MAPTSPNRSRRKSLVIGSSALVLLGLFYFAFHQIAERLRANIHATDIIASNELPFLHPYTQKAVNWSSEAKNPLSVVARYLFSDEGKVLASRSRDELLKYYSAMLLSQVPMSFSPPAERRQETVAAFDERTRAAEIEYAERYLELLNRLVALCSADESYCPDFKRTVLAKLMELDWWISENARSRDSVGLRDVADHAWRTVEISSAEKLSITICNYAPYDVDYGRVRRYPGNIDLYYPQQYSSVPSSKCVLISEIYSADSDRERITVINANNLDSPHAQRSQNVRAYVRRQEDVEKFWPDDASGWSTNRDVKSFCIAQLSGDNVNMLEPEYDCNSGNPFVDFGSMHFDENGKFTFNIHDPYVCGLPDPDSLSAYMCNHAPAAYARFYANNVMWKLDRESKDYDISSWPYLFGANTVDEDDPSSIGVELDEAWKTNPFGIPIPFQAGDVLLAFEGKVLFSYEDFNAALQEFARYRGAGKTFSALILRGGSTFLVSGTMYFNSNHWDVNCDRAFLNGVIGSGSLGWDVTVICGKQTALDQTWKNDQPFNRCYAHHWNERFRFRQFCPDEYTAGEFGGMFVSVLSVLRNGVRRIALGEAKRELGGLFQDAVTAGLIQALEEVIWSFSGAAPGRALSDKMRDSTIAGGQGFSVGVIMGSPTRRMR